VSKLTTDVRTVLRPPIKNQNMRTGKYCFTKKALHKMHEKLLMSKCTNQSINLYLPRINITMLHILKKISIHNIRLGRDNEAVIAQ